MVIVVNFIHYSVSRTPILFEDLVLLAPLLSFSHLIPKDWSYLVSCLGAIAGCAGMVQSAGSPMSSAVELLFSILGFLYIVLFSLWLVFFVWTCSACSCLESTKIVSCVWIRLWDNVRFMLMRFAISSLSYIAAYASSCSASAVLTWDYVSCVWFAHAPYPWAADVTFLRIW